MTEEELEQLIDKILQENAKDVKQYKNLHQRTIGHLTGAVLKQNKLFSPAIVNSLLNEKLNGKDL